MARNTSEVVVLVRSGGPERPVEWLGRALRSVDKQTFSADIWLLADEYRKTWDAFNDVLLRHRIEGTHAGSIVDGSDRKWLVDVTSHPFILFLDDDDYLHPDCLKKLLTALKKHPKAPLAWADHFEINADGTVRPDDTNGWHRNEPFDYERFAAPGASRKTIHHPILMRRSGVEAAGGFNAEMKYASQYELMIRMLKPPAKPVYVDEKLAYIRMNHPMRITERDPRGQAHWAEWGKRRAQEG